ncbi:hypothetical protein F1640_08545 [Novosphingobium sp. NBM11]|uniref:hypothetical protein n=1 Tax=Novosphingobium sp. NBM11 TaxID=2596914 RepID=UPI0018926B0B|nr:hypothetical protein [Novosphingobium sp. NBM11]MBF5090053.1 hypothetical protein [Novosphingobium sp. NBM11]
MSSNGTTSIPQTMPSAATRHKGQPVPSGALSNPASAKIAFTHGRSIRTTTSRVRAVTSGSAMLISGAASRWCASGSV